MRLPPPARPGAHACDLPAAPGRDLLPSCAPHVRVRTPAATGDGTAGGEERPAYHRTLPALALAEPVGMAVSDALQLDRGEPAEDLAAEVSEDAHCDTSGWSGLYSGSSDSG